MPCQALPTLPTGKANSGEAFGAIPNKGEGCTMWQVTANELIGCKKLKAPRNMIGCQKTFQHRKKGKKKTHRDSFFFIVIFLTLNWRPSAMSLLTSESLLGLGVLWFSVGLMIL